MPLRDHYRPIIASIIARVGTAAMKQLRKTLRDEFPDPPHKYHPYKVWLDEIAVQLKTKGKRKQEKKVKEREAADNAAGQANFFKERDMEGELVYLASPYSHAESSIMELRFQLAASHAAELMRRGRKVYSPIAHTHPIAQYGLPKGWDFWKDYDRAILSRCTEVIVLMLHGWKESKGVTAEIEIAKELGLPVSFLEPAGNCDRH